MTGGFFYGAFLNDLLLTEEDGIPYGQITGELMAGVILGNHAGSQEHRIVCARSDAGDQADLGRRVAGPLEPLC